MSQSNSPRPVIGYCTNVHAGVNLPEVQNNLELYSLAVKKNVSPSAPMGIGLWLSHTASRDLLNQRELKRFAEWLCEHSLLPFTFNGFPYHNFHQPIVKHQVYEPDWSQPERFEYTLNLAKIQNQLLRAHSQQIDFATLSTLPLGWPNPEGMPADYMPRCARQFIRLSEELDRLREQSGTRFMVCIEPEPGCLLDTASDVCNFFEDYLLTGDSAQSERIRNHIGVCHDVCHSSVMFEPQDDALNQYKRHHIEIGKFQISSAVEANFELCQTETERDALLGQLRTFREPRYLHQTTVKHVDGSTTFHEDLPLALESAGSKPAGIWRVHFHVPLFAKSLDLVHTTQSDVQHCLDSIEPPSDRPLHFELETYAWTVLPEPLRVPLADGITQEFAWFEKQLNV